MRKGGLLKKALASGKEVLKAEKGLGQVASRGKAHKVEGDY